MLKTGDHVIVSDNVYGGTFRLFDKVLTRYQLTFTLRGHRATSTAIERAFTPATRLLFVETPSNPVDAAHRPRRRRRELAHRARRPAGRGQHVREPVPPAADRARRRPGHPQHDEVPERPQRQRRRRRSIAVTRRGHRVAAVRAERRRRHPRARSIRGWSCAAPRRCRSGWPSTAPTASRWREFLDGAPEGARRCTTRGCPHTRSTRWPRGRCAGSAACSRSTSARSRRPRRLLNGVRLMALAESLGGVETLISHPATMTHASVPAEHRDGARHHRWPGPDLGRPRGHRGPEGGPRAGARRGLSARLLAELIDLLSCTSTSTCSSSSTAYGPWIVRDSASRSVVRRDRDSVVDAVPARRLAALHGRRRSRPPAPSTSRAHDVLLLVGDDRAGRRRATTAR